MLSALKMHKMAIFATSKFKLFRGSMPPSPVESSPFVEEVAYGHLLPVVISGRKFTCSARKFKLVKEKT